MENVISSDVELVVIPQDCVLEIQIFLNSALIQQCWKAFIQSLPTSISTLQNFSYADFVFVVFDEMKMDDKSVLIFVVEQLFCGLVVTLIDNSPFDIFKKTTTHCSISIMSISQSSYLEWNIPSSDIMNSCPKNFRWKLQFAYINSVLSITISDGLKSNYSAAGGAASTGAL